MISQRCSCAAKQWPSCGHVEINVQVKGVRYKRGFADFLFLWDSTIPPRLITEFRDLENRVKTWASQGAKWPTKATADAGKIWTFGEVIDLWIKARGTGAGGNGKASGELHLSNVTSAKETLGAMTMTEMENPQVLRDFVSLYLKRGRKIATPNRILAHCVLPVLRFAARSRPPLLAFLPLGPLPNFQLNRDAEDKRTRRCEPAEEAELLDACEILNTYKENYAGGYLRDFIILAIDLGARAAELFRLKNGDVNWDACTVKFRHTKRDEERVVPFNPEGRVADILRRRRDQFGGPDAVVIAPVPRENRRGRTPPARTKPLDNLHKIWIHAVCLANSKPYRLTGKGGYADEATKAAYAAIDLRIHDLRHEAITWWGECGVPFETGEWLAGHRTQKMHGRYRHEEERRARRNLAEFVWPHEAKRAVSARRKAMGAK